MRLFALAGSETLGAAIAAQADIALDPLEEREFPDGEHKSRPLVSVRHESVYVVHSLNGTRTQSPADKLMRLLLFLAACRENGAARVTAVVPYISFMRKEVQTKPRDPVNSKAVARLFEAVGTDMVVTLEAHNKAAFQNAFRSGSLHVELDRQFAETVAATAGPWKLVVLAPDGGSVKRATRLIEAFQAAGCGRPAMAMMEKHRSDDVVSGDLFAGDVDAAEVVIVDDIISTGGTLLRAAEAARARGASKVTAVATHALLNGAPERLFDGSVIDSLIVSDSVAVPDLGERERVRVVSCAGVLADTIHRLEGGGAVHRVVSPTP